MITYKNILDFLAQPTVIIVIVIACTGLVLLWQGFLNAFGKDIFDFLKKFFCKEKIDDEKNNKKTSKELNVEDSEVEGDVEQIAPKTPSDQFMNVKNSKIKGGISQK